MSDYNDVASASEALTTALPEPLRARCFLPGDDGYDEARAAWNTRVDLRPAAVAVPRSIEEVQAFVRHATGAGLRVAPISTGHAANLFEGVDLSNTMLLRLSDLTGVTVDPAARTARIVGGTPWGHVIAAAAEHGLAALHGSALDVSVAGYVLAGGLSFYARRHGLACNAVLAIDLVDAKGELVHASADENPTLFWALRGGGGSFGVAVAIEMALLPYPDVYAGMFLWDGARAPEVMRAWRDFTVGAPESVTTSFRVMSFPPLPELPPFIAGRQVVAVDGVVLETDADAQALLAPLRALSPEIDTFQRIPAAGVAPIHMDPPVPSPFRSQHSVLAELPDEAIDTFLKQVSPAAARALTIAELRQLGGALRRAPENGGAVSKVEGEYAMYAVVLAPTPEIAEQGYREATALRRALEPWEQSGARVPTFIDNAADASSYGEARDGLAAEAQRIDPRAVFVTGNPVRADA